MQHDIRRTVKICLVAVLMTGASTHAQAQMLTGYGHAPVVNPEPLTQATPAAASMSGSLIAPTPLRPAERAAEMPPRSIAPSDAPVDLQADKLIHDDVNQVVTASGNVMLVQSGRILRADEIAYDLKTDTVNARGHVVLNEESGDIHYADDVELTDNFKDGFVDGLKTYLSDGSRFTAHKGERRDGVKTTMYDATYTPCDPCKSDPEKAPVWQIRASEVEHDDQEHRVSYKNARFEVYGTPIAYTPYFSHPDGTIKRKSGFLSPSVGFKSELGAFATSNYYWAIAPEKDATIGVMAMTEQAPLALGQWRQRWDNAGLEINGGVTYSDRPGGSGDDGDEVRGHVLANGLWDMNEKWRSGVKVEWASDDQYMRQYDFLDEDVLENEVYAERFSGRNYAAGRLLTFQDIRVRQAQVEQPDVVPEIMASFIGEPGSMPVLGGRWNLEGSFLGLRREGDDQDINRMSLGGGWQRRMVSDYGLLTRVSANMRGDLYNTRDRDIATPGSGRSSESNGARLFPQFHAQTSYPMVREFETMQATIEPIAAVTLAPNIDVSNDIPNEDSQDVQIDASNIFEPNRFPGYDRVEDKSRVTYGIRTGLYGLGGSYGDIFLGQSHRFEEDDNPFPRGSGLDRQESDLVGQFSGRYKDMYDWNYRFQLDSQNFSSQRHEVDAVATWDRLQLGTRYLYANGLQGTDIEESREQIVGNVGYYLAKDWRVHTGATQDLGENPGLRKAYAGLDHFGQCVFWSLTGERNLFDDASGESDLEILFRIGLKNLGEFETSTMRGVLPDQGQLDNPGPGSQSF